MATFWRLPTVQAETGKGRSTIYEDISKGLMVKPVKLGARAIGFPADEVRAINAARISGANEDDIRELVRKLCEARSSQRVAA